MSRPEITVRARWPKRKPETVEYPVIALTSWANCLLREHPRYLLGGCDTLDPNIFTKTLKKFWSLYEQSDSSHPCFQDFSAEERGFMIPFAIHGDEGRGRNKVPTLVISYQGIISGRGMNVTTTKGFLACIKFWWALYSYIFLRYPTWTCAFAKSSGTATAPGGLQRASLPKWWWRRLGRTSMHSSRRTLTICIMMGWRLRAISSDLPMLVWRGTGRGWERPWGLRQVSGVSASVIFARVPTLYLASASFQYFVVVWFC